MKKRNAPQKTNTRTIDFVILANGKKIPASEVTDQQWRDAGWKRDPLTGKMESIWSGWLGFEDGLKGLEYVQEQRKLLDALEPVLMGRDIDMALMTLIEQACSQINNIPDEAIKAAAFSSVQRTIERSITRTEKPQSDHPPITALH